MGSNNSLWIRNAQIVKATICVVISGIALLSSTTASVMAASPDAPLEKQVFDGYDSGKKQLNQSDLAPTSSTTGSVSPSYQATLEKRLSDLEQQNRELTGKVEQLSFENESLKKNFEKAQADFDLRLNQIKSAAPTAPAQTTTAPASGTSTTDQTTAGTLSPEDKKDAPADATTNTPSSPTGGTTDIAPANSPTQQNLGTITQSPNGASISPDKNKDAASAYETAYADLKAGKPADAQSKFEQFLKQYPEHPLRANAIYWLGETYYAQANYIQSTKVFAESYKKYPKGPKAADSLLKMGLSLEQINKNKEACVTFKQLKKEFSVGQAALIHRADAEMAKISCK